MAELGSITVQGRKGSYAFNLYSPDARFKPVPAVYVFGRFKANAAGGSTYDVLYVGQTDSLADRIPQHEKWPCVVEHGANTIGVHRDPDEDSRRRIEADLIEEHDPPCNIV